jgi:hypothetical protein
MKIPKRVKIGWKKYKIIKRTPERQLIEVANYRYGEIDYDKRTITINSDADQKNQEATFIHEVIHGISEMYKLEFDEKTVELLGDAMYTFLKDNHKILK